MRSVKASRNCLVGLAACLLAVATTAAANAQSAALRARAYDLAYNLDHDEAVALFRQAIAADPNDVASYRGLASVVWLNISFKRGAVTVDDYLGSVTKPNVAVRQPPPELAATFKANIDKALVLAEGRLKASPRDPDAYYQIGATVGLLASYTATIDGRVLGAFRSARRAYDAHEKVLELDPRRQDAGLVVGTYRYVVSALSLPVRWMAYIAGFGGGKERGLRLIEGAVAYPGEAQTEAQFALVLLYNREKRYQDALRVLAQLQARYPRNRLLWLEAGATTLRAGRPAEAERWLTEGMAMLQRDARPRMFGEDALWRYKCGAARLALGRGAEAEAELRAALAGEARNWVLGRTHTELGRLAERSGDRARARREYETAGRLCRGDNDSIGAAEADTRLDGLNRRR